MTGEELRANKGIIVNQCFGRDKSEYYAPYSEKWAGVQVRIDYTANELVVELRGVWSNSYNKKIKIKL